VPAEASEGGLQWFFDFAIVRALIYQ